MTDQMVVCNYCDSGPFPVEAVQNTYNATLNGYEESCPKCGCGSCLAWPDNQESVS